MDNNTKQNDKKDIIIVISAPSGAGKTTLVKKLLLDIPILSFSVSSTTRPKREHETHGVDYYFITQDEFNHHIKKNDFIEWEMVYTNRYYGTLKTELDNIWNKNKIPLLELDVNGSIRIKKELQTKKIYSIFIQIPSITELEDRLIKRGTEDKKTIKARIKKAEYELDKGNTENFDLIVLNDNFDKCLKTVKDFLAKIGIQ